MVLAPTSMPRKVYKKLNGMLSVPLNIIDLAGCIQ
jgi:hypothetical protein